MRIGFGRGRTTTTDHMNWAVGCGREFMTTTKREIQPRSEKKMLQVLTAQTCRKMKLEQTSTTSARHNASSSRIRGLHPRSASANTKIWSQGSRRNDTRQAVASPRRRVRPVASYEVCASSREPSHRTSSHPGRRSTVQVCDIPHSPQNQQSAMVTKMIKKTVT